jgi:hypothetical protein
VTWQPPATLVPDGWTREGWIERLEYMVRICVHERRKAELQAWLNKLRQQSERQAN